MTLYDPSLEKCVIGALCIAPELFDKVVRFLRSDDFTNIACSTVYETMYNLFINDKEIDVNLLPQCLIPVVSKPEEFIRECLISAPTKNNLILHAHVIHDAAVERRFQTDVMEIFDKEEKDGIFTAIDQKIMEYRQNSTGGVKTMFQLANDACDKLGAPMEMRLDTGFPRLDGILKGMWGGNLIIVGARPGTGKSCFGLDLAEHTARTGKPVLYVSLEMLGDELIERLISKRANIPMDHMIDNAMTTEEIQRYVVACADLSKLPITYEDHSSITVPEIKARARQISGISLIVIDYIGLLKAAEKNPSRNLELGAISRDLKNLATDLRIPVVAMAQLNRQKTDSEEPQLSDLRDSGELEQNASKVIFLWNVDSENGIKGCKVAKNRRGKCGRVQFNFEGEYQRFTERSEDISYDTRRSRVDDMDYDVI